METIGGLRGTRGTHDRPLQALHRQQPVTFRREARVGLLQFFHQGELERVHC